jgi:hypothetical protein
MPKAYDEFMKIAARLEKHYKDIQDVEFTIERGKLWMLQTRNGKRTAQAAVKIAVDMAKEGLITKDEAVERITPENVDTLLHPQFNSDAIMEAEKTGTLIAKGVNASLARPLARFILTQIPPRRWQRTKQEDHHGSPLHQARRCTWHDRFKRRVDQRRRSHISRSGCGSSVRYPVYRGRFCDQDRS